MEKVKSFADIIPTISEDQEVTDFSEDSDEEIEFQPTKHKKNSNAEFDSNFEFVSSLLEYNRDSWNDLTKYVKRKVKNKTDDKIKKMISQKMSDSTENSLAELEIDDNESEVSISEDELQHDSIKLKKKDKKGKIIESQPIQYENRDIDADVNISFYQMNLSRPLLKAITEMKFVHPTPVQASTIPIALLGKDICGCAATGTGKTAAYMLPTLERLLYRPSSAAAVTRVLVLVPTRELGVQVYQVTKELAQFTNIQIGLAVGGLDLKVQETILRKNPDVVIATPGRLIDHLKSTPTFSIEFVEVLILDEADRMLDEFFAEQMNEIIKQCSRQRQTMLFSATMTEEVEQLAALSLSKPVRVFVDSNKEVAFTLRQEFIRMRKDKEVDREPVLASLVCRTFREQCMVFVQTKKQAHRLHVLLGLLGLKVAELHGNLSQPQRLEALEKFKTKQVDILVATDVAARGLDISGVKTVINFSMPNTIEHYIHRVGRTARAGRAGVSVSLAGELDRKIVKEIIKSARNPVKARVIPREILEKYKKKLEQLETEVNQILLEEHKERLLSMAENQANRAEKLLNGVQQEKRPWFQTKKERQEEKARLRLKKPILKLDNKKKKNKKTGDSENKNLSKIALLQAKFAKRKQKKQRLSVVNDENNLNSNKVGGKKVRTHFSDITDTSNKNTKNLRHEANSIKKMRKKNIKTGKQSGKIFGKQSGKTFGKQSGKTFGKPQKKKYN